MIQTIAIASRNIVAVLEMVAVFVLFAVIALLVAPFHTRNSKPMSIDPSAQPLPRKRATLKHLPA